MIWNGSKAIVPSLVSGSHLFGGGQVQGMDGADLFVSHTRDPRLASLSNEALEALPRCEDVIAMYSPGVLDRRPGWPAKSNRIKQSASTIACGVRRRESVELPRNAETQARDGLYCLRKGRLQPSIRERCVWPNPR